MITCDACLRGRPARDKGEGVSLKDIAMSFTPPPGLGLRPIHLCWECTARLYNSFVGGVLASREADLPVKRGAPKTDTRQEG